MSVLRMFTGKHLEPVVVEDSAVTTTLKKKPFGRPVINGYLVCDGPGDIEFTVGTTTFTMKAGEVNDVPFSFHSLQWKGKSASAFRLFGVSDE